LHHPVPFRLFTNDEAYLYETTDAKVQLASKATSWSGFVSMIRDRLVDAQVVPGNSVLVEHSPSAAVGIAPALREMPNLKVVHLVRDPRDAISSMMKRREKSPVYEGISADENLQITAEQWSLLTAAALQAEEYPGYLRISYEELVLETNATMARVLDHLGHKDAKRYLAPISFGEIGHQPGWRNSPKGAISASSIGRYRETLTAEQIERLVAMEFDFPELGLGCAMRDFVDRFSSKAIPGEETDVPRTRGSA